MFARLSLFTLVTVLGAVGASVIPRDSDASCTAGVGTPITTAVGDTCDTLASQLDILLADLQQLNPGLDCSSLVGGQQICVPDSAAGILPTGILPTGILPTGILPTGILPTGILPTGILPTSILPTGILPTDILPTDILPTGILPTDILPTGIIPTGIIPTGIIPTGIIPTGILPSLPIGIL
ncbi:hypothetical protein F5050DRAFT_1803995 [Lentinula boryana]|uniref:LysM domain-containing protein n=1 Tax=Lentinula boryana TaxID=40481 RepID=A0ABQ8QQ69_9AGAR|nr:hypothetical protein F5050DRAFT_1803995 [Lentinula boryana]